MLITKPKYIKFTFFNLQTTFSNILTFNNPDIVEFRDNNILVIKEKKSAEIQKQWILYYELEME